MAELLTFVQKSKMAAAAILNWYFATLDHPRSLFHGRKTVLKFHVNRFATFRDMAVWKFCKFGLKRLFPPPKLTFLGDFDPQTLFFAIETPKRHFLARNRVIWAIVRWNWFSHFCCRQKRKGKKKGKERYKKSQNGYISRICTKAPSEPIPAKFGTSREVADVITRANSGVCKLRGWGIRGVEFWHLPLKWLVTLTTVLRYRAACDLVAVKALVWKIAADRWYLYLLKQITI